jgi:uncharacterized membrane protein YfcA
MGYFALPVVGFLIGFLIISVGGGGGGIYVGILTALFNVSPAIAASTSLATIIPTTAIGTVSHWKAGNIHLRYGIVMLISGAVGAIIGSLFSSVFPKNLYNKFTGIIILLLGVQMIISFVRRGKSSAAKEATNSHKHGTAVAVIFGIMGGALSGLVGISGSTPIVAGLTVLGCSALQTVGTSVMVLVGISVTGFLMHLGIGSVDWKLVGLLAAGTMTGAFVAPMVLKRFDKQKVEKVIQPVLVVITISMGILLLFK